ncbi:hypothetical protein AV521_46120, partial [Streptomyces sp. IMTB 2501]|uniref:SulP family inorganic anion transporter n=1 Tax=Streptomyces sp. IMTB 2501 TaxID=1776340 RepID=UPI00097B4B8B
MAGLPPVAGLRAVLPALGHYTLFGTSRLLSVGPESTTALMTATVVGPLAAGDPGRYASQAAALDVTVGLLGLAARAVRLGFLADLLSRPVLIGCLAGVAVLIAVDQLPRLTGMPAGSSEPFSQLAFFFSHLPPGSPGHRGPVRRRPRVPLRHGQFLPALPGPLRAWCSRRPPWARSVSTAGTGPLSSAQCLPGSRMIDVAGFRRLAAFRRRELFL